MHTVERTLGRRYPDKEVYPSDPFLKDFYKITQSKSFRRLSDKTQMITGPINCHIRTRMSHTEEVVSLSATLASELGLNVNLCLAIAQGHDIGHSPYGHIGESVITELGSKQFDHTTYGVVVAQHIERYGKGLNLTYEVLEGISCHGGMPDAAGNKNLMHQEYAVVQLADTMCWAFSDLNDAMRSGIIGSEPECAKEIGMNQRERLQNLIATALDSSRKHDAVCLGDTRHADLFCTFLDYLNNDVYKAIDRKPLSANIRSVQSFFSDGKEFVGIDPDIATLTLSNHETDLLSERLRRGTTKECVQLVSSFGISDILESLRNRTIDYADADLDWVDKV